MIYRMFVGTVDRLFSQPAIRRFGWKLWYERLAKRFDVERMRFMNYGYTDDDMLAHPVALDPAEEGERLCMQLYEHLVSRVDTAGKRVLEVGSGRGGGCRAIHRHHHPAEVVGLDRSHNIVRRLSEVCARPGLRFVQGDAEALPFDDNEFAVVVNVESSHCYGRLERFFAEVARVLQPGGHFLFTDFRPSEAWPAVLEQLAASGLQVLDDRDITENVVRALDLDHDRRVALIEEYTPRPLHRLFRDFAATRGSATHQAFTTRRLTYRSFLVRESRA